ncbi:MAG: hypothetical protein AB3N28_02200 [Kordiimonas sp.]
MLKTVFGAVMSVVMLAGVSVNAQSGDAEAAAAYDGTGVKPPEELVLQIGPPVGDIRLPVGTRIDDKKSSIYGSGPNTYGRVYAAVRAETSLVKRFFIDNMPGDGWELISEFQSDDITLVYQKPTRVVVVLIERGKRTTDLRLTMTPRS